MLNVKTEYFISENFIIIFVSDLLRRINITKVLKFLLSGGEVYGRVQRFQRYPVIESE